MEHTLKLTITAVGENDSVFLTPCEPVTLHESAIERPEGETVEEESMGPVRDGGLSTAHSDGDVMVIVDEA